MARRIWFRSILAALILGAALPSVASAVILRKEDGLAFAKQEIALLELGRDISETIQASPRPNGLDYSALDRLNCLGDLYSVVEIAALRVDYFSTLTLIGSSMHNTDDRKIVADVYKANIAESERLLQIDRKRTNEAIANCSSDALVVTKGQILINLLDKSAMILRSQEINNPGNIY